ncbi:MAG: flagellar assembly protein FliX [Hyphomonadaceae bacterium]
MKIDGVRGPNGTQPAQRTARAAAPGFAPTLGGAGAASSVGAVSGVTPTAALDTILALQGGIEPDGRAKQARRGKRLLDALEELARGLLAGVAPGSLRGELMALHAQAQPSGDLGLDAILLEIDTRAAVELAKLESLGRGQPA